MDLVLLVDFLLPVTLKDSGKSTSPKLRLRGTPVSSTELKEMETHRETHRNGRSAALVRSRGFWPVAV